MLGDSYEPAVVTYLDILGFRRLIEESKVTPAKVPIVRELLATMKEEFSNGGRVHQDANGRKLRLFNSFNFSDLTVRCTKLTDNANLSDYLNWELLYLADKQLQLAISKVFIRGGICKGEILANSNVIFGPALVKAYKLESDFAVYPRIVIDRDLVRDPECSSIWLDYIKRGEDGAYFIDYLFGATLSDYTFPKENGPTTFDQLRSHRDAVMSAVAERDDKDERAKQKLIWLCIYHNDSVARLFKKFSGREDALRELPSCSIPESSLNF